MACIKQEFKYAWLWGFIIISNLPLDDTILTRWESMRVATQPWWAAERPLWIANELWICLRRRRWRRPCLFVFLHILRGIHFVNFILSIFICDERTAYKHDVVSRTTSLRASAIHRKRTCISMCLEVELSSPNTFCIGFQFSVSASSLVTHADFFFMFTHLNRSNRATLAFYHIRIINNKMDWEKNEEKNNELKLANAKSRA